MLHYLTKLLIFYFSIFYIYYVQSIQLNKKSMINIRKQMYLNNFKHQRVNKIMITVKHIKMKLLFTNKAIFYTNSK